MNYEQNHLDFLKILLIAQNYAKIEFIYIFEKTYFIRSEVTVHICDAMQQRREMECKVTGEDKEFCVFLCYFTEY